MSNTNTFIHTELPMHTSYAVVVLIFAWFISMLRSVNVKYVDAPGAFGVLFVCLKYVLDRPLYIAFPKYSKI